MKEEYFLNLLKKYNQTHILRHCQSLSLPEREKFISEMGNLDFKLAFSLYEKISRQKFPVKHNLDIYPSKIFTISKNSDEQMQREEARLLGESLIYKNKIAVLIVAGGHGSRLGFNGPKGMFPISPLKNKSLFQFFAESVRALSLRYKVVVPLLIMTDKEMLPEVEGFFKTHNFFGLDSQTVHLFEQEVLPTLTVDGKLILKDKTHLFVNPNGHGGCIKALHDSGLLKKLIADGYSDLFYCQIDNPLVKIMDPSFVGYHKMEDSEISTKVVRRASCEEKVGIFAAENGKAKIIEYSELGPDNRCILDDHGQIRDWAGNTAIHMISLVFVQRLNERGFSLPYHRAIKMVNSGAQGKIVEIEGWKFETFIFDAIPLAKNTCCMEISREEEFAPLKNKHGDDSPDTVRKILSNMYKNWLNDAGIRVGPQVKVEISPLFALSKEELFSKIKGMNISGDRDIYLE
ncbi:MAG: UTP--glucose-1-phosphate uridylyltransferase [Candidatus Omnitrophica bacterium]|nr:UTP--glucose-1-phosphate uridylyltransferase [Candidatus Omnitrophota bacterium]MBU4418887.1 UTP--glucose-1-phosphate uridylyltransferase [Candidatus Omnitrophota bacterium]MBU4468204.1 UTP--glucose-1-phosphate uridylyltransferase [Candidatus Omnitrophota bacterium]MCG2708297.1 UTP--glucose-1-phosphate uridylyltransferase [Candidatus Omnitrophota bacterium]